MSLPEKIPRFKSLRISATTLAASSYAATGQLRHSALACALLDATKTVERTTDNTAKKRFLNTENPSSQKFG